MKTEDEDLREHAEFRGLRNNVDAAGFDLGDLEVGLNIDIDDALFLKIRKGHSAVVAAGAYRSLWAAGSMCLAVIGNALVRILPGWSTVTLRTGLTPILPISYTTIADRVYYSNGAESGVIQGSSHRSWGLTPPVAAPAALTGGALRAGRYQYALTYLRSDGQESGASRAAVIELTETAGFQLSLTASTDPTVTHIAVYVSDTNGETLSLYARMLNSTSTFSVFESRPLTVPLATQFLSPPPAGAHIAYGSGRMLVAAGNRLYPSEPYAPELFDLRKGVPFLDRVTLVAPLRDGTWVGTGSQVIWLPNAEPEKWEFFQKAQYGVIPGTLTYGDGELIGDGSMKEPAAFFATSQGLCAGLAGGQLVNFTDGRYSFPTMDRGASIVRRHRGIAQLVVSLQGTEVQGNTAA